MNRRTLLALTGGALAVGVVGCGGTAVQKAEEGSSASPGARSSALGSTTIGLTYIPNIQFAPFYWALDKDLFADRGVTATLRHHGASEALFTALNSGTEQFAIAGGDEVLQANSEGMDLVTVAGFYQRYPVVLIVPAASPIKTLADLKGRIVGLPGQYGESWFGLQVALRTARLTTGDVTIRSIGYTQQAALTTGKVDAIVGFSNNDVVQFAALGIPVRAIPLGTEIPLVSTSVVATRKLLESRPELVKAVCRATVAGVQAVVADPAGAVQTSVGHIPGMQAADAQKRARATLDATIPLWKGDEQTPQLKLDATRFTAMESFMRTAGLLTKPVDASRAVDTSILG